VRVRDHRVTQLERMPNVEIYLGNHLNATDTRELDSDYMLIATGARWRRDGLGRSHARSIETLQGWC